MRISAFMSSVLIPAALVAQAPVPTPPPTPAPAPASAPASAPAQSLGDRVKAERLAVEPLNAEFKYLDVMKRAEALLPATKPVFDKSNNQALLQSCSSFLDTASAYRFAAETADAAGAWEKALDYAKAAKALATDNYANVKEPLGQNVTYYTEAGARAKQVLTENEARIKELKAKSNLEPGERQELDLALGVEKEAVDDAKWSKFFQTYIDVAKRESEAYDPLVKVMEDKLKSEADQVADYKPGKGDRSKWVDAVVSSPAYLEAQGDKAGKARWLHRLATVDPENKKVQRQLDALSGKSSGTAAKPAKKGK